MSKKRPQRRTRATTSTSSQITQVAELIALFEREELRDLETITQVLWEILSAVEDYFDALGDDQSRIYQHAVSIPLAALALFNDETKDEALITELIEELGGLTGLLSGLKLSDATRQRLRTVTAASDALGMEGDDVVVADVRVIVERVEADNA
jgi:hypothetical protein